MAGTIGDDGRFNGREVLTEEEYHDKLERVIENEYFPDLQKMREQVRFIDAMDSGDVDEVRRITAKYATMTPTRVCDTPLAGGAAAPAPAAAAPVVIGGGESEKLPSLQQFLAKNVAESDASFGLLYAHHEEERRGKQALLYGAPRVPRIAGGPQGGQLEGAAPLRITENGHARNDSGAIVTSAGPGGGCMPPPPPPPAAAIKEKKLASDPADATHAVIAFAREAREGADTGALQRLQEAERVKEKARRRKKGRGGRGGSVSSSAASSAQGRHELLSTPIITPGEGGGESPFVTWGMVDGTPLVLHMADDAQAEEAAYAPPPLTQRDIAHQKLTAQAGKRERPARATPAEKLLQAAGLTPTPTPQRGVTPTLLRALTPRHGGGIFSKVARGGVTPARGAQAPPTPRASTGPAAKRRKTDASATGNASITDDLLDI